MRDVKPLSIAGDADVQGIAYDSRKVRPGFVFVAMHGESSDGNRFIDAAIRAAENEEDNSVEEPAP